jgi:hypothetical protein
MDVFDCEFRDIVGALTEGLEMPLMISTTTVASKPIVINAATIYLIITS